VPKELWRLGDPAGELRRVQFQAPEVEAQLFDAKTNLATAVDAVRALDAEVAAMASAASNGPGGQDAAAYANLVDCMRVVKGKCAAELSGSGGGRGSAAGSAAEAEDKKPGGLCGGGRKKLGKVAGTLARLAAAHKELMTARRRVGRYSFRWHRHILTAVTLEHVVARTVPPAPVARAAKERSSSRYWDHAAIIHHAGPGGDSGGPDGGPGSGGDDGDGAGPAPAATAAAAALASAAATTYAALACLPNLAGGALTRALWNYRIYAAPYVYMACGAVAEVMSLLLMWSEATIWINLQGLSSTNLSVFGQLLWAVDQSGLHEYFAIQVVAAIPLAWMCLCSTYAIFRLKFFDVLDLSGNQNTDPYALCINAALMNRLQFSLAFNYLNVLMHSSNKADFPNTAFMNSVGAGMALSVVDWYLPILMPVIYALNRANVWQRIMRLLGIEEVGSPIKGNSAHEEIITDGAKLITKARRALGLDAGTAPGDLGSLAVHPLATPLAEGADGEGGGRGGRGRVAAAGAASAAGGGVGGWLSRFSALTATSSASSAAPGATGARDVELGSSSATLSSRGAGGGTRMTLDSFNSTVAAAPAPASAPASASAGGGGGGGSSWAEAFGLGGAASSAPAPSTIASASTLPQSPSADPWGFTSRPSFTTPAPAPSRAVAAAFGLGPAASVVAPGPTPAGAGGGSNLAALLKGKKSSAF